MKKTCLAGLLTGVILLGSVGSSFAAEKSQKAEFIDSKDNKFNVVKIAKGDNTTEDFVIDEVIIVDASECKNGEPLELGGNYTKKKLSLEEIQKLIEKGIIKAEVKSDKIIIKK